jgi:hypothetical protein
MSVRMNYVLQKLAQKFLYVKFLRIIATDADAQYDDYALPTLLIYKVCASCHHFRLLSCCSVVTYRVDCQNGDLVTSLIRVTDELPDNWDQDDVEVLMAKYALTSA